MKDLCTNLFSSAWVDPRDTWQPTGTQGECYSFGISFFPVGEGSCSVLKTTMVDPEDIPTGFVRDSRTGKIDSALSDSKLSKKRANKLATFEEGCYVILDN